MDFNEIVRDPKQRAALVAGILLTGEATDLVRDWVLGTVVHTPDTTKVATLQGMEVSLAQLLLRYSDKFNDKERAELAEEFRQLVDGASERSAEVPELEVTQMWLRDFAKEHGFDDSVVFRLWLLLDRDADVRKLAKANGVDLRLGSRNGFQLNQLRALSGLPDLTKIRGLSAKSQSFQLLEALVAHGLKAPKAAPKRRGRQKVEVKDEFTFGFLGSVADAAADKLNIANPTRATQRLFTLLGSEDAQALATANDIDLTQGPDNGYTLKAVRAFSELPDLTQLRHFSKESQSYRLLREAVKVGGK